jgi:ribosomal protein S18 acetylase RimI-like enzyme
VTAVSVRDERFDGAIVQGLLAEWNDELGFAPKGGSTVADGDFTPPDGVFLVAVCGGAPAGCAGLRRLDATTGEVKRLFVRRNTRGRGMGRALLDALEQRARAAGLRALRLDTDGGNAAALALFRSAGYEPIGDYNANPYARHWFEKRLAAPRGDA